MRNKIVNPARAPVKRRRERERLQAGCIARDYHNHMGRAGSPTRNFESAGVEFQLRQAIRRIAEAG